MSNLFSNYINDVKIVMTRGTTTHKILQGSIVAGEVLTFGGLVVLATGLATKAAVVASVTGAVLLVGGTAGAMAECYRMTKTTKQVAGV